ncbi:DUF928 domain-containing protein [Anabaena sp. UHCC 0253]|uniref:DUF928 domain-containing protein n=1 Tax=Anabaena sp. UHCC 0253 TaxID=2590019 RepID=UPI00144593F8|nr:DUF928 domain-containing protein [Anabaena sp. UHCC 0253]MTJ53166.1 DUF928 domain-containing protein [Anabaena sp. UHCC 0253]
MNLQKYIQSLGKFATRLSPALIILSTSSSQLLAQTSPIQISLKFPSASDRGAPERTVGGGRRGTSCITLDKGKPSLTALMPTRDNVGNTTSDTPSLYVYVPKNTAKTGEFVLMDEIGDEIYKANFPMPNRAGIVKLNIPKTVPLKVSQRYQWYFTIACDLEDWSRNEFVKGSIQRIALSSSVNSSLTKAEPLKQAKILAQYNVWHDTLDKIAQVRTQKPSEWKELITSVGLQDIVNEPILDCCQAKP